MKFNLLVGTLRKKMSRQCDYSLPGIWNGGKQCLCHLICKFDLVAGLFTKLMGEFRFRSGCLGTLRISRPILDAVIGVDLFYSLLLTWYHDVMYQPVNSHLDPVFKKIRSETNSLALSILYPSWCSFTHQCTVTQWNAMFSQLYWNITNKLFCIIRLITFVMDQDRKLKHTV